ncbi:hypothetical protein D3C73_807860 [compost metagenome]
MKLPVEIAVGAACIDICKGIGLVELTSSQEVFAIDEKITVVDIHHRVDVAFLDHIDRDEGRKAMWPYVGRCLPIVRIHPL